jgi:hypothetical protein
MSKRSYEDNNELKGTDIVEKAKEIKDIWNTQNDNVLLSSGTFN